MDAPASDATVSLTPVAVNDSIQHPVDVPTSFHAMRSPYRHRRRARQASITREGTERQSPPPPLRHDLLLVNSTETPSYRLRDVSVNLTGRTHSSQVSEPSSERTNQWPQPLTRSINNSSSSKTQEQLAFINCNSEIPELGGQYVDSNPLRSTHYYVAENGQLRLRKLWWCYRRLRRILWYVFPWLKRDSNTFLSASMVANSTLILVVYVIRKLLNYGVVPAILAHKDDGAADGAATQCHDHSLQFFDMYVYTLIAIVLLCLPALDLKACRLYQHVPIPSALRSSREAQSNEPLRLEKTYLFTLCELIVVLEIPYLLYILVIIFIPTQDGSLSKMITACNQQLATGFFVLLVSVELVAVYAYILRWKQILLFHRLHQHFLFQRGYVPGHTRFEYVEQSFATPVYAWLPAPLWACWQRLQRQCTAAAQDGSPRHTGRNAKGLTKQIHDVKIGLYRAAKRGDVDQIRVLLDIAIDLSGPDFATEWYEPYVWNLGGVVLLARGQRNPLHVAIAFHHVDVVHELLANGHFDVQQLDKLELLRLDVAWLYRVLFRVLFFVLRRSSAGVVANASLGGGTGNGGVAPGLASASHPFGPVGLFQATLLSPLHVAVTLGHVELTLLLLRYGAQPDASAVSTHPRFATPPLYWAVNKECTRLLLDAGGNPLALPGDANGLLLTAFEVARIAGNAAVARQMEKYGGDVALTPLHDACAGGRHHDVLFLLEHGADPDTLGEQVIGCFRRTPLHWAAMRGHARIIRLLVRYGVNVNARDVFGRTPLAWACVLNRTRAVEALLASNADVNLRDAQGDPLLCICAAGACASIKRGSKTVAGKQNKFGDECVDEVDWEETADEGGDLGATLSGQKALARELDPCIFQLLLTHGVDLHATRASNGDSALHVALRRRHQTAAILFVRAGLSLTAVNFLGQRAIDCAQSPALRFAVKKEAGQRDVMISYSHAHAPLARKLRDALEQQRITTWIDTMGPTGITGGSVWRQEIARGIQSSALVVALLTKDYPESQWCMKELAFAKMQNIPVVAIQCEDMDISEELQVYLWTRQVIDFRPAVKHMENSARKSCVGDEGEHDRAKELMMDRNSSHTVEDTESYEDGASGKHDFNSQVINTSGEMKLDHDDDEVFSQCLRMLLDGIQDQIELHRARLARRQAQQQEQVQLPGNDTDGRGSCFNDSECFPDDDKEMNRIVAGVKHTEDVNEAQRLLNSPIQDRIESLASSFISTATDSFVFIIHGDFHLSFCRRLLKTMRKEGIRCVVDETVPAVQQTHFPQEHGKIETSGESIECSGLEHPVLPLPVQMRQLAAKDAILACSAVIVVLSPLSANCDLLADQIAFAEDRGKLLVPILLSLHKVDLAKRYTFSRSMVHHFNVTLGYEQSMEQLTNHLRAQQEEEARERRQKRRCQDHSNLSAIALMSSGSSASMLGTNSDTTEMQLPFDDEVLPLNASQLLPTLPVKTILTASRGGRVTSGSSGGHGWSELEPLETADNARTKKLRTGSNASIASSPSRESSLTSPARQYSQHGRECQ